MKILISEIEEKINEEFISNEIREIVDNFLSAINDWPNPVLSFEEYESEVYQFIDGETNKNNIEQSLKKNDFTINAWQSESLTQILEVFKFYREGFTLKQIIADLNSKLK